MCLSDIQLLEPEDIPIQQDIILGQIQLPQQLDQIDLLWHPVTEQSTGNPLRAILIDNPNRTDNID